jgi:RNA polymerase sigma-70 factor (ECF subfamily)
MTIDRSDGEQLVELLPVLRRNARALTGSVNDAEDLVQATVEKALKSIHQWMPGTRLDSWIFCIVRSVRVDQLRKKKEVAVEDQHLEANGYHVDGLKVVESRLMLDAVRKGFDQLPEEQREMLYLICVEQMTYREAAGVLNVPIGTVMSRLARARLALHAKLATGDASERVAVIRPRAMRR